MKKRWLQSAASAVLVLTLAFAGACSAHRGPAAARVGGDCPNADGLILHPTVQLAKFYEDIDYGCMWIVPYFHDIMAIYSLRHKQHLPEVKAYIDWVFAHLNAEDRWGISGTIFDYVICCDGTEIPTLQYDSADGYAGQFLMLLDEYHRRTRDTDYIVRHKKAIFDVAYVLLHLQDERDGLAIAMIGYPVKYTMDNSEGYGGLAAFCELARRVGWGSEIEDYTDARDEMKKGILSYLYDPERRNFRWALDNKNEPQASSWDKFYPDALSQIFPILYGVIASDSPLAKELWREYARRYKESDMESIEQKLLYRMTAEKME
ncbi:MAG: hypothetical protein P9L99_08105 [Candidatus Lernaella stagnicola]|nr:hypothetical protein [Candidatus Lernaella stagnicola]